MNFKHTTLVLMLLWTFSVPVHTRTAQTEQSVNRELIDAAVDPIQSLDDDCVEDLFFDDTPVPELPRWKIWVESIGVYLVTYYISLKEGFDYYKNQIKKMLFERLKQVRITHGKQ